MDKQDAKTLAYLLRGDLVAESYVPTRKNRERRAPIRIVWSMSPRSQD